MGGGGGRGNDFQIPKYVLEGRLPLGWKITLVNAKVRLSVHYDDHQDSSAAGPCLDMRSVHPSGLD